MPGGTKKCKHEQRDEYLGTKGESTVL